MADVIRVVVADDDPLVRVGISLVLGGGGDIEVVAEAADGAAAIEAVARTGPQLVLMDIRMPVMDGLAATEAIRAVDGAPSVVVLTTFDTDEYVLRALRAGANGFLLKDTPPTEILECVRRVAAGEPILSPSVLARLIDRAVRGGDRAEHEQRVGRARVALQRLSQREREVAEAIGRGGSNAEIGAELYMSVATVKAYVSRILTKLQCSNRVQVAIVVHESRG